MVPVTPPLIRRLILSLVASPDAIPSALKVRSSHVPVMRPPLWLSLLLISMFEL